MHSTQKPVAVCEWLIRTYSNAGDTVLDCCMGSGTTIVAALSTGRKGIGIEQGQVYFDIAARRCKQIEANQTASTSTPDESDITDEKAA